jgi:hypothetical protein
MATGITTPLSPVVVSPVIAAVVKAELACVGSAAVARSALRMISQQTPSALQAAMAVHFDTMQFQVAFEDPASTFVRVFPGYMGQPPASTTAPDDCPPDDPVPESVLEPELVPAPEPEPEPEAVPEPEPELVLEPDVCPEPELVLEPDVCPVPVICPELPPMVSPELPPDVDADPPDDPVPPNGGGLGPFEHPTTTRAPLTAVNEARPMAVRNPDMLPFLLSQPVGDEATRSARTLWVVVQNGSSVPFAANPADERPPGRSFLVQAARWPRSESAVRNRGHGRGPQSGGRAAILW